MQLVIYGILVMVASCAMMLRKNANVLDADRAHFALWVAAIFGMYAVSDAEKMDDLCWTMMHDMTALAYSVTDIEVARAKNQLKSSLLLSADGTSGLAEEMGRQILTYGRHINKEEMYARIDAVDVDAVKGVAGRLIQDNEVAIAAMGDTTSMQDYHWFRRMTYWLTY